MKTIYSDLHRLQDGQSELINGKLEKCFECPERADLVLARVQATHLGPILEPTEHGIAPIERVHAPAFVDFLRTAWDEWVEEHGEYDALPLIWQTRSFRADRVPEVIDGKLSYYALDAGTPITAGTYTAIRSAVDVALTGVDLIMGGDQHAFALCRPPGHHAAADQFGGYCFFNNAAVAAQALRDQGVGKVGILDVDYHHGNGTQAIFYDRDDVVFASLHGHPSQEYPYFLGYDDEMGTGAGLGANRNFPMRHGTAWDEYSNSLDSAIEFLQSHKVDALVVSLGVDTYKLDPISQFKLEQHDFSRMGERIGACKLPTLTVFEGGYAVADVGINAVNVVAGIESAS